MPEFLLLFLIDIGFVLELLSYEKSTNTNTIPAFGLVFQYNTIRIAHPCHKLLNLWNNSGYQTENLKAQALRTHSLLSSHRPIYC